MIPTAIATGISTSGAREFDDPSGLAMGGGHLWVTNEAGNSLSEINPATGSWIATINSSLYGFRRPTAIASDGPYLFVTNAVGTVSELRASDGAFIRSIAGANYRFADPVAMEAAFSRWPIFPS